MILYYNYIWRNEYITVYNLLILLEFMKYELYLTNNFIEKLLILPNQSENSFISLHVQVQRFNVILEKNVT